MNLQWLVIATWAGNLQNIPLHGEVRDYKQKTPGQIVVAIRCNRDEMIAQVDVLTNPSEPWCSDIRMQPYFEALDKEGYYAIKPATP